MPLTPLHLAAGLPVRRWMSLTAFILINLMIDLEPAGVLFFGMDRLGYAIHGWSHTIEGVFCLALPVLFAGLWRKNPLAWCVGTYWGGVSHLILDGLVHSDMRPFNGSGNPLFLDLYHEVSSVAAVILVYYLTVWVISLRVSEVAPRLFQRFLRRRSRTSEE